MTTTVTTTLAWHVDHWAREMAASGTVLEARAERGAGLASACRGERAAELPAALVALARRLPEGDLAALEAHLVRSLARTSA